MLHVKQEGYCGRNSAKMVQLDSNLHSPSPRMILTPSCIYSMGPSMLLKVQLNGQVSDKGGHVKRSFDLSKFRIALPNGDLLFTATIANLKGKEGRQLITKESSHSYYMNHANSFAVEEAYLYGAYRLHRMFGDKASIRRVLEVFGGSGWEGKVIETSGYANLKRHALNDLSIECFESMRRTLGGQCELYNKDYVELLNNFKNQSYDFVIADFNNFTPFKAIHSDGYSLKRIFEVSSHFVKISDSSVFGTYRFERNREAYAKILGIKTPGYYLDLYPALSRKFFYKQYGFSITKVVVPKGRTVALLLLEKGMHGIKYEECEDKMRIRREG